MTKWHEQQLAYDQVYELSVLKNLESPSDLWCITNISATDLLYSTLYQAKKKASDKEPSELIPDVRSAVQFKDRHFPSNRGKDLRGGVDDDLLNKMSLTRFCPWRCLECSRCYNYSKAFSRFCCSLEASSKASRFRRSLFTSQNERSSICQARYVTRLAAWCSQPLNDRTEEHKHSSKMCCSCDVSPAGRLARLLI